VFLGGRVKGGLYGAASSLTDLQDNDLKHTVDFRSLYATVGEKWWGVSGASIGFGRYPVLDVLA